MLPENLNTYFNINKRVFLQDSVLFNQGESPSGVYYLIRGSVKISKTYNKGKERILKIADSGDILGLELFVDDLMHSSTAVVLENSEICYISKEKISEIIREESLICYHLLTKLYKYISSNKQSFFSISMSKIDEYLLEIETEHRNYSSINPIIIPPVKNKVRKNKEFSDKQENVKLKKRKENYFQLKIRKLIC